MLKKFSVFIVCLVMILSVISELWCIGVNAVAETIMEATEETGQVLDEPNLAVEIPDGVEDAVTSGNITLTEDTAYRNLEIAGGIVDLNGFTLTIYGDVLQPGGTIELNGGSMVVHGDYRIQSLDSDGNYSDSSGILKM
ncbi:MAG: hypothetical protein IJN65_03735, partial [Clostridia bacterium]|nr:hypothetical protein [Clostridia bacterium]